MTIFIKPLSVNQAWQGRRFKTDKYKSYIKELTLKLPKKNIEKGAFLRIDINFGFTNVLSDIDNPLKPFLDIIQAKYKINDRDIYELNVKKTIVKESFIEFEIIELKN